MESSGSSSVFVKWLKSQRRDINPFKFHVVNVWEENVPTVETVNLLSNEFVVANLSPKALRMVLTELKNDCDEIDLEKFKDFIEKTLPDEDKVSTLVGSFGEIISALYLVQFESYWLPVYKLRYREKRNWAMRMTDVFVVNTEDNKNPIVCYGEVKTNTSRYKPTIGVEGYESIKKDNALENPDILRFLWNTLSDQGEEDKALFFIRVSLKNIKYEIKHKLFLINDSKFWKDEILENLNACDLDSELRDFTVYMVVINDLKKLFDDSFRNSWREAEVIANDNQRV